EPYDRGRGTQHARHHERVRPDLGDGVRTSDCGRNAAGGAERPQCHPRLFGDRPLMLDLDKVTAGYGRMPVLHGISFSVDEGKVTALVGSNGAGKSTTLRV